MNELTIADIDFFWTEIYIYDHKLHGFTFEDNDKTTAPSKQKIDEMKELYKDLL